MKILTFGVPPIDFIDRVSEKFGKISSVYVCESRPYEQNISEWIKNVSVSVKSALITDNMVASLLNEKNPDALFVFGEEKENGMFSVIGGTRSIMEIGDNFGLKSYAILSQTPPKGDMNSFFGKSILVDGVEKLKQSVETVKLDEFVEVL